MELRVVPENLSSIGPEIDFLKSGKNSWMHCNQVNHLEGKALGLHNLARWGKFWSYEEDIKAELTTWEVVCKRVLNYGGEVWACSSKTDEQRLERIQNRAGRRILGLSWRFHGVVVKGELGWRKLKYDRHKGGFAFRSTEFFGRNVEVWMRVPKIDSETVAQPVDRNGIWAKFRRSFPERSQPGAVVDRLRQHKKNSCFARFCSCSQSVLQSAVLWYQAN